MRLIDADEMLVGESRAYMSVQLEMDDFLTRQINRLVHLRIQRLILAMPTIEAEPVRHGKWMTWEDRFPGKIPKKKNNLGVFCSECGLHADNDSTFCPSCGARMDVTEK